MKKKVIITAPSLDPKVNVSGISSITQLIIENNCSFRYHHFEIGKKDNEKRNIFWVINIIKRIIAWVLLLRKEKSTIVHFNFALQKLSILRDSVLMIIARLLNKRMVIHLHGGEFLSKEKMPVWIKLILDIIFSWGYPIIVLSELEKENIARKFSPKNLYVLNNCVSLRQLEHFKRNYDGNKQLTLLFLGRITKSKGIDDIYNAFEILIKRGLNPKFKLAGQGDYLDKYLNEFEKLLKGDFEYKGVVYGPEKEKLLKECDIFLLPSFYEGLPMALLETMSYGIVPVVTAVGSIKQIISHGENGIYVGLKSPVEIAEEIEKLHMDRKKLEKISLSAMKYIQDKFSPPKFIEQLNAIYLNT